MNNKKIKKPNVVRGGIAVPLGRNYYYMSGRTHENGGIDIGKNPDTGLEVEDGEVMHIGNSNIKVFSAQPFLNGESPAEKVIKGENPNNVFTAQESFKRRNKINDDGTKKKRMGGKRKNNNDSLREELSITHSKYKMGGLSRSKDYGSKSKPYPSVKSEDFAGGGRSYPIPTKADARDALRLAGLHGRSDVKAKVYKKYPELRQKAKAGGIYSVTSNGETKLHHISSTGDLTKSVIKRIDNRRRAEAGTIYKLSPNDPFNIIGQINRSSINPNNALSTSNNIDDDNYNNNYSTNTPRNTNLIEDGIGLTSNIIGGLISNRINNNMLNNLEFQSAPIPKRAAKLKTRININPQLDKMRESLASYERDIDNNTRSSQVALARKQRARLANILSTNELYGNKENIETELINKDRLNQQEVTNSNIDSYNDYVAAKRNFDNSIIENKASNNIAFLNTINSAVQNTIYNRQKRNAEDKTIATMAFANPNLPIELFYKQGIISKEVYDAYINAYRKRNKTKSN